MSGWTIWALILALGSVTFAQRVAFLLRPPARPADPVDQMGALTTPAEPRVLRFGSPAGLSALLVPALISPSGSTQTVLLTRVLAGLAGLAVACLAGSHPAWRRYVVPLTLLSGLCTSWGLSLVGL